VAHVDGIKRAKKESDLLGHKGGEVNAFLAKCAKLSAKERKEIISLSLQMTIRDLWCAFGSWGRKSYGIKNIYVLSNRLIFKVSELDFFDDNISLSEKDNYVFRFDFHCFFIE